MSRPKAERRPRQYDDLAILDYIDSYQQAHRGRSPSQRRITDAVNLSTRSLAHTIIHRLITHGLLTLEVPQPGWPADLEITGAGRDALQVWRTQQEATSARTVGGVESITTPETL